MKTKPIQAKLKLLLLTLLSASAVNFSAFADSLYVSGTTHPPETGEVYSATSTAYAALQVAGTSATGVNGSYSGTNITLNSTFTSGNGSFGAYVYDQGQLALTGGTITTSGN
jgi:hypothetical protein